jgi:hypothetical protein
LPTFSTIYILTTSREANSKVDPEEMTGVAWHSAEMNLIDTHGDVLAIFDCCNAGRLCQYRGATRFEYLGACSAEQVTPPPGPRSFTSSLIWALQKLNGTVPSFPTSELQRMITKAPNWQRGQTPPLGHRNRPSPDHIRIAPLGREPTPAPQEEEEPSTYEFLDLRFHFKDTLNDKHIIKVAEELSKLISSKKTNTKAVSLIGIHVPAFTFVRLAGELYTKQKYGHMWQKSAKKKRLNHESNPSTTAVGADKLDNLTQPSVLHQIDAQVDQQGPKDAEYLASPAADSSTPSSEPPVSSNDIQALSPISHEPNGTISSFVRSSKDLSDSITPNAIDTGESSSRGSASNQQVQIIRHKAAASYDTPDPASDVATSQTSRDTTPSMKMQPQRTAKKRASPRDHGKPGSTKKMKS